MEREHRIGDIQIAVIVAVGRINACRLRTAGEKKRERKNSIAYINAAIGVRIATEKIHGDGIVLHPDLAASSLRGGKLRYRASPVKVISFFK